MYASYRPTCFYRDCKSRNSPTKCYFELPSDNRRDIWLRNSGISDEEASRIILYRRPIWICEDHFEPKYMQQLPDGRKILIQHAYSNPIPFKKVETEAVTPSARQYLYDEQATHMLQLFDASATSEGELHDYTTLAAARGYVQPTEQQAAIANEQLLQNYMLQSQLFFTQPVATPTPMQQAAVAAVAAANVAPGVISAAAATAQPSSAAAATMQTPTQPTPQRRRTYNRTPRNQHHVYEEEPEPPKKEVMCFSVEGNAQKAKQAKPTELDDIEEMLDTYFIVNDKNGGTTQNSQAANNGMILGN